jgi:hypothetical protein
VSLGPIAFWFSFTPIPMISLLSADAFAPLQHGSTRNF